MPHPHRCREAACADRRLIQDATDGDSVARERLIDAFWSHITAPASRHRPDSLPPFTRPPTGQHPGMLTWPEVQPVLVAVYRLFEERNVTEIEDFDLAHALDRPVTDPALRHQLRWLQEAGYLGADLAPT